MPPRPFSVADLNARGEVELQAEYEYRHLEQIPGAIDLIAHFSSNLWRSPEQFEMVLAGAPSLSMRWFAAAPTAGIATLRSGDRLASISLLVSGINADSDQVTLHAYQQHLLRELHDSGIEPAFELLGIDARPLVATINFAAPSGDTERAIFALADRCFAAAYFRKLGLC
jgi:hypothetical protein